MELEIASEPRFKIAQRLKDISDRPPIDHRHEVGLLLVEAVKAGAFRDLPFIGLRRIIETKKRPFSVWQLSQYWLRRQYEGRHQLDIPTTESNIVSEADHPMDVMGQEEFRRVVIAFARIIRLDSPKDNEALAKARYGENYDRDKRIRELWNNNTGNDEILEIINKEFPMQLLTGRSSIANAMTKWKRKHGANTVIKRTRGPKPK